MVHVFGTLTLRIVCVNCKIVNLVFGFPFELPSCFYRLVDKINFSLRQDRGEVCRSDCGKHLELLRIAPVNLEKVNSECKE